MKKGKIIILSVLLLALVALTSTLIAAWLTDTKTTPPTEFTVGDVKFQWVSPTWATGPIVPGQDLIPDSGTPDMNRLYLTNTSTVKTQLRVKVTAIVTLSGQSTGTDAIDLLYNFSLMDGWTFNQSENTWYYNSVINPQTSVDVINTLVLDGAKVGNTYSQATLKVSFLFEAKQAEYVTWEQLGQIDFETGLAAQG